MTLALQNYVDKVGPAVNAAWLNEVDQKRQVMSQPAGANGFILGLSKTAIKASTTSRSNTNVLAADPDLAFANCEAGSYRLQAFLQLLATTTTTQGFQFNISSAAASGNGYLIAVGIVNNVAQPYLFQQGAGAGPVQFANVSITATDFLLVDAVVSPPSSGTIAVSWSQRASGANAVAITAQSWATLTRLA